MILGPVGTVAGLIKYRIQLYHVFFWKNYVYGNINVKSHERFEKLIPLISSERLIIEKLWKSFISKNGKIFQKKFINDSRELMIELYLKEVQECNLGF